MMDFAPVFALIIGIDLYQVHNPLNGAVADANAFECFLKERFPSSQITTLLDAQATRENIKLAFERLRNDPAIQKGDAIIIYFAGHGGRAPVSDDWMGWKPQDSQIEMICPVDIGIRSGLAKTTIGGIPDLTVAIWLNGIAREKGNNITLILDCCHSAGANRCDEETAYVPRRISNPPDISLDDYNIWASDPETKNARSTGVPLAFVGQNQESHVLLAACGQIELAFENDKRGLFTRGLLDVLRQSDLRNLTYTSLIQNVRIPKFNQNPQCQGRYRDRVVFNAHTTRGNLSLIQGFKGNGMIVLKAGEVHGIKESSHFAIYRDGSSVSSTPLCTLIVKTIMPTTSNLSTLDRSDFSDVPSPFYAREISKELI
ncbi:hypothetical protein BD410DRAFT_290576 [Rickenella mellea]|uniref:Peptidase C14 caspase domain-containing protein n=1 Tax=Rickenella mellea TaxID=50990 RepID=A0A4Y7Q360_9AGAM|nr:hypothetical protein BD410DRAFT_290576 [Rickenella mellea]